MAEMYIDEKNMRARGFLIHADSDSIRVHWETSKEEMSGVMEYCTPKRIEILGQPDDTVMKNLWRFKEEEGEVTMTSRFAGFSRLRNSTQP